MGIPLRVLLVEDSEDDALLIVQELQRGGYEPTWNRVETESDLAAALERATWDLIACDWVMPRFSAPAALTAIEEHGVDVPILIVSGEVGEAVAVTAMKAGAHDYVSKDNLTRLVPAVQRELREAEDRRKRRQAEETLRESEARFTTAFAYAPIGMALVGMDGRPLRVNRALCQMFGYKERELLAMPVWEITHPDDMAATIEQLRRLVEGEIESWHLEKRFFHRLGHVVWGLSSTSLVRSSDGRPLYVVSQVQDITERKRAEEERARLSAAVEQTAESIMVTDPDGAIVYINPACERLTGYSRAELCGQTPRVLRSDAHDREAHRRMMSTIRRGKIWFGSEIQKRKDGSLYEVEVTISPVRNDSGQIINQVGIGRDVTHERRVEAQLHQARRLEAVGRLAGGVAHDFNNQLTVIKGSAQLLLRGIPEESPQRRHLERIAQTVDQGARLIRQLLTFSRIHPIEKRSLDLSALVNEMAPVFRLLLREHIALSVETAPRLWCVRADRVQIERLIMNLVVNARDALMAQHSATPADELTAGRSITLATANVDVDDSVRALARSLRPGPYVVLVVADTGPGMPPEVRDHVFEPFFTTKESGQGTGLGLATVFGIVKQHEGAISCTSETGQGTTFRIYLPRDESGEVELARSPVESVPRAEGSGEGPTVLVAEDEDSVREVVRVTLEESGYRVLSAGDVDEAVAIAETVRTPIALLVTDMVMPGGSGRALARWLRQTCPEMRVLFISGYHADSIDRTEIPGARFLQKPFGLDELIHTIGEMLT